jgi:hypothetical protein
MCTGTTGQNWLTDNACTGLEQQQVFSAQQHLKPASLAHTSSCAVVRLLITGSAYNGRGYAETALRIAILLQNAGFASSAPVALAEHQLLVSYYTRAQ